MENLMKGTTDVRSSGQADRSHRNSSEYYCECDQISEDRKEKIDIKKATANFAEYVVANLMFD